MRALPPRKTLRRWIAPAGAGAVSALALAASLAHADTEAIPITTVGTYPPLTNNGFNYYQAPGNYTFTWDFTANTAIDVTQLGYYNSALAGAPNPNGFGSHLVTLYDVTTTTALARATVTGTSPATGVFNYAPITAVRLNTSDTYEVSGTMTDQYYLVGYNQAATPTAPQISYQFVPNLNIFGSSGPVGTYSDFGPSFQFASNCTQNVGGRNIIALSGDVCVAAPGTYNPTTSNVVLPVAYNGFGFYAHGGTINSPGAVTIAASDPNDTGASHAVWAAGPGSHINLTGSSTLTAAGANSYGAYASDGGEIVATGVLNAATTGPGAQAIYASGPGAKVSLTGGGESHHGGRQRQCGASGQGRARDRRRRERDDDLDQRPIRPRAVRQRPQFPHRRHQHHRRYRDRRRLSGACRQERDDRHRQQLHFHVGANLGQCRGAEFRRRHRERNAAFGRGRRRGSLVGDQPWPHRRQQCRHHLVRRYRRGDRRRRRRCEQQRLCADLGDRRRSQHHEFLDKRHRPQRLRRLHGGRRRHDADGDGGLGYGRERRRRRKRRRRANPPQRRQRGHAGRRRARPLRHGRRRLDHQRAAERRRPRGDDLGRQRHRRAGRQGRRHQPDRRFGADDRTRLGGSVRQRRAFHRQRRQCRGLHHGRQFRQCGLRQPGRLCEDDGRLGDDRGRRRLRRRGRQQILGPAFGDARHHHRGGRGRRRRQRRHGDRSPARG